MAEQQSLSPELVILSKKLAQAQAEYDNLRTSMVQQVTNFRRLVKVIFELDNGYFGGRFQAQEATSNQQTPQLDLAVALQVVEAVSDELQGATAFADSPLLRDQVANLVAAVDSLRDVAIEADRAATSAVGLQAGAANPFPARTFPDHNPLACLTEAVGFLRDLQGLVAKLKDRVGALVLMAEEADEARNEAEAATANVVSSRSADKISASLAAELDARDQELAALRQVSLQAQEEHAEEIRRIRTEIRTRLDAAQEALERERELRRGDYAEACSLAAEIQRLAEADPEASASDDLDITLGVLRDALADREAGLDVVTGAAEGVLTAWAAMVGDRATAAANELVATRTQLMALQAEAKRLGEAEKGFNTAREAVSKELSQLRTQVAEQTGALHERDLALAAHGQKISRIQEDAARVGEELVRERAAREEERQRHQDALGQAKSAAQSSVGQFESVIQSARSAAEKAESQLAEVRSQLAAGRLDADRIRLDLTRVQSEADTAREAAKEHAQRLAELTSRSQAEQAKIGGERDQFRRELAAAVAGNDAAEQVRNQLASKLATVEHARALNEAALTDTRNRCDQLEREVAALTAVRDRLAQTEAATLATQSQLGQAQQRVTALGEERDRLAADLARHQAEAAERERHLSVGEQDRTRTQTALSEREARIAELAQETEVLRRALTEATTRAEQGAAELARIRTLHDGAVVARDQATTELAAKLTSEAAASAERDTAKAALTTAYAERDRLQAESERQRADLEAQTAQRLARETEFATKLAEAARQAGEAKQIADTMREANERLRLEIEKTENRSSTDLSRVERKATETRKMAESLDRELHNARERVTELAGQLEESRSAERNLFDRAETEAAMAEGNARRWNQEREELIGLVKAAKNAVQNAKVARESDLQRIAELEGQLTILKSLKSGA